MAYKKQLRKLKKSENKHSKKDVGNFNCQVDGEDFGEGEIPNDLKILINL